MTRPADRRYVVIACDHAWYTLTNALTGRRRMTLEEASAAMWACHGHIVLADWFDAHFREWAKTKAWTQYGNLPRAAGEPRRRRT